VGGKAGRCYPLTTEDILSIVQDAAAH
jgi:hypothetical protein